MISAGFAAEKGLLRLRLSVTHQPEPNSLQVELTDGGEAFLRGFSTPLATLGLAPPDRTAERSYGSERDPSREAVLGGPLTALFSSLGSRISGRALWLELARPKGILPCLPWERWLAPLLGVPVLRLPRHLVKPVRSAGAMHVAWCAGPSSEAPAARVARLAAARAGLERAGARPLFHVFADSELEGAMAAFAAEGSGGVTLYPTARCRTFSGTGDGGGPLTDPWLAWMSRDLEQGIDLVCFDAEGSLARGRGGLSFRQTPLRGTSEGLRVEGGELAAFLEATGASGLALSSPPGNPNRSALLALADEIVDGRPGPVLVHDAEDDAAGEELGRGLAFLYGDDDPPPSSARLALFVHPDRLEPKGDPKPEIRLEGTALPSFTGSSAPLREVLDRLTLKEKIRPPALRRSPASLRTPAAPAALPPPLEAFGIEQGYSIGEPAERGEEPPREDPDEAFEAPAPPTPAEFPVLPRWIEASQRVLERHVAWSAEGKEVAAGAGKAAQEGSEEALRFVQGLLSKIADKGKP